MEDRIVNLRLSGFEKEGLYLLFPDSTKLELTKRKDCGVRLEKLTFGGIQHLGEYQRVRHR